MAKQTELKNLLLELEIATRHRERVNNCETSLDEKARAFHEADRAEKRVFSFFDALHTELEESARAYKLIQAQRDFLVQERDKLRGDNQMLKHMLESARPAPVDVPFDAARARAGEPIQYKPLQPGNNWADCKFIGMRSTGEVVVEIGPNMFAHPVEFVRIKPTTQTVQMFANVFKDEHGARAGALYGDAEVARKFVGTVAESIKCVGVAIPVNVTVVA